MTILPRMIGQFSVAGGEEEEVVWSVGRLIRDGCFARLIYGIYLPACRGEAKHAGMGGLPS
jgi:hypothetical protein